ncbi:MFS transporter [Vibrio tapetis]|uniref:Putative transport protein (MFS superfamily protein) n=1 Tax=Vibrio tapetis subsp. tapetis TaxID=1671868 RepID=A0A2N8ZAJ0_9VIBR|nr:MFS transporter [Vibrio tapetis]SON48949.1 putative transport protein (MFS superfamily protein) [Vibrio tapetis subsp. tapetis]
MLASIYTTQYIGIAFILSAALAILRQQGVPLDKLALLNLVALPLIGKIFYAPVIDKYRLVFQGKYRSWLIFSNIGMVSLLLIVGSMDIVDQFSSMLAVICLYVLFMSLQDVSVDGLSCKLFQPEERKFSSSVQFSGNLLGNIIGGGVLLIFYPWLQWQGSFLILSLLTSFALFQVCMYKEPESEECNTSQSYFSLFKDIKGFLVQHKYWFCILLIYPLSSTWGFALLSPILIDSGWSLPDVGFSIKIFGSIVGFVSAMLAAYLIAKVGRNNALMVVLCFQVFALSLMIFPALGFTDKGTVHLVIAAHFISFPALLVISATIFMDKASLTYHKATFFTLQISVASFIGFVYSWASMAVAKHVGYSLATIIGSVIALFILILVWRLLSIISDNGTLTLKQYDYE